MSSFFLLLCAVYVVACVIFKTTFIPELIQLIRVQRIWGKYKPRTADLYMQSLSRVQNERVPARAHFKRNHAERLSALLPRKPIAPILERISEAADALFRQEVENLPRQPSQNYLLAAASYRDQALASLNKAENFAENYPMFEEALLKAWTALVRILPKEAYSVIERPLAYVPLVEAMPDIARDLHTIVTPLWSDDNQQIELFDQLIGELQKNTNAASGAEYPRVPRQLIEPHQFRGTARQVVDAYLRNTALYPIFDTPVPFDFTDELGEHAVLVAPSGWGKTSFMHSLVLRLLSQEDPPTLIVLNSQGKLLRNIERLSIFAPGSRLSERLVIIDPEDERQPALNLFKIPSERLAGYTSRIREQIENGTIETFQYLFASVANDLTAKQTTMFNFVIRLLLARDSTLQDFFDLLQEKTKDDKTPYTGKFAPDIARMDGVAQGFFQNQYFTRAYSETRGQIAQRVLNVIHTPTFARMFGATENKFDLFSLMNRGSVILVNTSRAQLGNGGSAFFGRMVTSMLIRASYERVAVHNPRRVLLLIDEASDYVDQNFAQILAKVRQFGVGCLMAFQEVSQISILSSVLSNTAVKLVGGVSANDARAFAADMRTTADFILSMQQRKGHSTDFATYVRGKTPTAVRMAIPFLDVERQPRMSAEDHREILARNRRRYAVTATTVSVTITESQARSGARVEVAFNGRTFKVSIPAGTKNGAMLRLRDATDAGDLYVKIIVVPDPSPSEPEPDAKPSARRGSDDGDDKHTKPSKDY